MIILLNGGSGEIPGPTVKVWMGEGKEKGLRPGLKLANGESDWELHKAKSVRKYSVSTVMSRLRSFPIGQKIPVFKP